MTSLGSDSGSCISISDLGVHIGNDPPFQSEGVCFWLFDFGGFGGPPQGPGPLSVNPVPVGCVSAAEPETLSVCCVGDECGQSHITASVWDSKPVFISCEISC